MNIWYFHHYGTPYEIPGLHRPFEFGSSFCKEQNKIAVFTSSYLHYSGDNMNRGGEKYNLKQYDGVDAVFVKTCSYSSKIKRVLNMFGFAWRLFGAAKWFSKNNWKPDVIVASSPHPFTMLAGLMIAKKMHIPCVCEVRDFWPEVFFLGGVVKEDSLIGKLLLRGERYIYEKADKLLFLKEGDHTYITDKKWDTQSGGKIPMTKCAYINNGVDVELFEKRQQEFIYEDKDLSSGKFNVVYCGTIRPVNNIDMLLDVAKKVPDAQFLIFGTGNCVEALQKRIDEEKIENAVLKGYVQNQYVPSILNQSSLNILNYSGSSYNWSRGNSSNKLFEYLASGKPVLSTVKMGYDIIEKYNCGYSSEKCSADEIASIIKDVMSMDLSEYEALCNNAKNAAKDFDIPTLAKKYLEMLELVVKNYGGAK